MLFAHFSFPFALSLKLIYYCLLVIINSLIQMESGSSIELPDDSKLVAEQPLVSSNQLGIGDGQEQNCIEIKQAIHSQLIFMVQQQIRIVEGPLDFKPEAQDTQLARLNTRIITRQILTDPLQFFFEWSQRQSGSIWQRKQMRNSRKKISLGCWRKSNYP